MVLPKIEGKKIVTAWGFLAKKDGRSWTKELIKERKKDLKKEEEKIKRWQNFQLP